MVQLKWDIELTMSSKDETHVTQTHFKIFIKSSQQLNEN